MRSRVAACAIAGIAACSSTSGPPLDDLPRAAPSPAQPPLVLIPGLLASRLVDPRTDRRVWPPNLVMLLGGWRTRHLEIPVPYDGDAPGARLSPTEFVLSRPRRDFYAGLLDTLAAVGYECVPRHELTATTNCVLFSWDWRRGFVSAAAALDALVDDIRRQRGDPALQVDLLAHSAGAMVARYFARFGGSDVVSEGAVAAADPHPAVRRMVLVGPPNDGSIFAAERLMLGYPVSFLTIRPEVLATFGSAYELLPHPDRDWLVDVRGKPVTRDLYDPDTWRDFRVSIFDPDVRDRVTSRFESAARAQRHLRTLEERFGRGLARGRRFHEAISRPPRDRALPDYLVLGSDCTSTPRYFVVENAGSRPLLRFRPEEVQRRVRGVDYRKLMSEPGDGRVTRGSLLSLNRLEAGAKPNPPASRASFELVCERHSEMPSSPLVQRATLEFLLG